VRQARLWRAWPHTVSPCPAGGRVRAALPPLRGSAGRGAGGSGLPRRSAVEGPPVAGGWSAATCGAGAVAPRQDGSPGRRSWQAPLCVVCTSARASYGPRSGLRQMTRRSGSAGEEGLPRAPCGACKRGSALWILRGRALQAVQGVSAQHASARAGQGRPAYERA